jgi:hypothetical protein
MNLRLILILLDCILCGYICYNIPAALSLRVEAPAFDLLQCTVVAATSLVNANVQHFITFKCCVPYALEVETWAVYPKPDPLVMYNILVTEGAVPSTSFLQRLNAMVQPLWWQSFIEGFFSVLILVGVAHVAWAALTYKWYFEYNWYPHGDLGLYRNIVYGPLDVSPMHQLRRFKPDKLRLDYSWWDKQDNAYRKWLDPNYTVEDSLRDLDNIEYYDLEEHAFEMDLDPFMLRDMSSDITLPHPTLLKKCPYDPSLVESDLMGIDVVQLALVVLAYFVVTNILRAWFPKTLVELKASIYYYFSIIWIPDWLKNAYNYVASKGYWGKAPADGVYINLWNSIRSFFEPLDRKVLGQSYTMKQTQMRTFEASAAPYQSAIEKVACFYLKQIVLKLTGLVFFGAVGVFTVLCPIIL